MNSLIVPTLGIDVTLLSRLADSIDCYIQHKIVILNGKDGALDIWNEKYSDWKVICNGTNNGVAGSWNMAQKLMPNEKSWLICNDDTWFPAGILKQFCKFGDAHSDSHMALRLNDSSPYYCFIHTKNNIEDVGTFDENFWPAYYEDCDYNLRLRHAGITWCQCFIGQNQVNHGKPRCGGMDYNAMLQGVGLFNRRYWFRKWGSDNMELGEFKTPFNVPGLPISFWELDTYRRNKMQAIYDEFIANPKVSLYD